MNPTMNLLETSFTSGLNSGASDVTSAVGAVGGAIVLCIILVKIAKSQGAAAAVIMAALFGGLAWWLLKMSGMQTIAQVWDATIKTWFK